MAERAIQAEISIIVDVDSGLSGQQLSEQAGQELSEYFASTSSIEANISDVNTGEALGQAYFRP